MNERPEQQAGPYRRRRRHRGALGWLSAGLLLALCPRPAGSDELVAPPISRLRLRPKAQVRAATARLADLLVASDADQRLLARIGAQPIDATLRAPARVVVTHDQVARRLRELGVNLARVLIGGAARCQLVLEAERTRTAGAAPPETTNAPAAAAPPPTSPRAGQATLTLADVLRARVNAELAALGGSAEIEFERAGQQFLALTRPPWEFLIRAAGGQKLGLREFEVVIRRDGRTQRRVRLAARVKLVKRVLVARRPLGLGSFIRSADLALEPRLFAGLRQIGLDEPGRVIGQQVKRYIPAGEMIRAADLKAVDLVRRARPVSVSSAGAHVRVELTGVALDSGGYGDTVRVRIGQSRRERRVLRGVVTGVGHVRLLEDWP